MKKSKDLSHHVRQARFLGLSISLRAGKLRIKDPTGAVIEETVDKTEAIEDEERVKNFVYRAFKTYVFRVIESADLDLIQLDDWEDKIRGEWKLGELTLIAHVQACPMYKIELRIKHPDGLTFDREVYELTWHTPNQIGSLLANLISDFKQLQKLRAYLSTQDQTLKFSHGYSSDGAINVIFLDGKMVVSLSEQSDFDRIRKALGILEGFVPWCAPPETPRAPDSMESTLDLL